MTPDETSASDEELAARLRAGEDAVLARIFERHHERLWRMVRFRLDRRLAVRIDPEDVLQEAYLAAADRVEHFRSQPDVAPFLWLRWIVGQTLVDLHRRHLVAAKRNAGKEIAIDIAPGGQATSMCLAAVLAEGLTTPSQAMVGAERLAQLEQAIRGMSEIDQEIIALRHFEDLTNLEAAALLNLSPTAASNRYVRAIARLKEILSLLPEFHSWPS